ncbi:hypothetical protein ACOSQ3_024598 [Xanthoceras sorbifolium]
MTKYGMATPSTSSTSTPSSNLEPTISQNNGGSGYGNNDNSHIPHMPITGHKLNGHNYLQWSQSVTMFICGKGRDDYITGISESPAKEDPAFKQWKTENSMVMSWLINSMTNEIGENFLLYETAREIWKAAKETYSSSDNTAELFGIESNLYDLRQGELTQLDLFEKYQWKNQEDSSMYKDILEQKRIFRFLLGLNPYLDEVRSRTLATKPLPSIREVFSEVRREESRKRIMLGSPNTENSAAEGSALFVKGNQNSFNDNKSRKNRPWCEHCKRLGHLKETCWKLFGKPLDWKSRFSKDSRGNTATGSENTATSSDNFQNQQADQNIFSREQMDLLQRLFNSQLSQQQPVIGTGSVAQKGTFLTALNASKGLPKPWIVDSGASDHMTGDRELFYNFVPNHSNSNVKIADGSLSKVEGTGSITISPNLTLHHVLLVPSLDCSLLSVSKLTNDLKCVAKFSVNQCVFQDSDSGRMIGNADLHSGLYLLKVESDSSKQFYSASKVCIPSSSVKFPSSNKDNDVFLWHYRLGHPNFVYLEKLLPSLFINKNPQLFECEVCRLSKQSRQIYPTHGYKQSRPFSLIHSDVWGPSRVPNVTGARWFVSFIDDHTRLTWVFLMKEKSEVSQIFQNFVKMIQNQFETKIQIFRTDNGKEFFNNVLNKFLLQEGIVHQSSCPETPQQNGVSERKNRHILEVARSLLFTSNVPKFFWGEAVLTATYLINRLPSRVLNFDTPCHVLLKHFPHTRLISHLPIKVFGCTAFVQLTQIHRSKLDPKSIKCLFVGYSPTQKGYKCYSPTTKRFYFSKDVTFMETQSFYDKNKKGAEFESCCFWEMDDKFFPSSYCDITDDLLKSPRNLELQSTKTPQIFPRNSDITTTSYPLQTQSPIVYTRNRKTQKQCGVPMQIEQHQESEPSKTIRENFLETTIDNRPGDNELPMNSEETRGESELQPEMEDNNSAEKGENELQKNSILQTEKKDDSELPIAIRKGLRECRNRPIYPLCKYISYDGLSPSFKAFSANILPVQVPNSIEEAMKIPEWVAAVNEEIRALEKNKTWEVTELPKGKHPVGCKWVFTVKYKADGSIERFKARLVAKGFTQSYGIDYEETFAPVAKLNIIRILLSMAANLDWKLHQLDVKNAFLNGELEEEVYMNFPAGITNYAQKNLVCRLKKSLYGLKQSPRAWFERFSKVVKLSGFMQCQSDHTMFVKHSSGGNITVLIVYVDDIILTGNCDEEIQKLKCFLAKEFEIKDLGSLRYFLGMEIARSKEGIMVSQRKYILDLLKETGMTDCKPAETPMDYTVKLGQIEGSAPVDKGRYQRLVGKLIYLSHTRPDIGFPVSSVSQFMNKPTEEHMEAVFRILRYLKLTPGKGLFFKKNVSRKVEVFTDADWAGSITDRRSTSGYCTFVWGNLVTWRNKKQSVVSRSSAEAEFRAMAHGICEGVWLKRVLAELKMPIEGAMRLFCDNQSTIRIAKNPVHHDRTKHVEIDRHFIKEKIEEGSFDLSYMPTASQTADILTKPLARTVFDELCSKLGMIDIYHPA